MSTTGRLEGKVAIITGRGADPDEKEGIASGHATARVFAREGASVAIFDIDEKRASYTADVIAEEGGSRALALKVDVGSSRQCEDAVEQVVSEFGQLNFLVNNVGVGASGLIGAVECSEEEWDRLLLINLKSAFLMTKFAVPRMIEAGGGSIVNISSVSAERGFPGCAYSVSKNGVNALTRDTAIAYGRSGVRANALEPGFMNTPMSHRLRTNMSAEEREAHYKARMLSTPLGTEGTGWDIANAALFLASEDARWITGVIIPVDGGVLAKAPSRSGS